MLINKCSTYRISSVDEFAWLAELDKALLQVVQGAFHQTLLFLEVRQQVVPQGLLSKIIFTYYTLLDVILTFITHIF